MYNVKSLYVLSIQHTIIPELYNDMLSEIDADEIRCYRVKTYVNSYEKSDFYNTGIREDYFFLGTVEGKQYIVSINAINKEFSQDNHKGFNFGIETCAMPSANCFPEYIAIYRVATKKHETVTFEYYCKVVAAGEVGYDSYNHEWHKARCVALKCYALYHMWVLASPDKGYHIDDSTNYQLYNPSINLNSFPNLMKALKESWNDVLLDSNGNVINTQYRSRKSDDYNTANRKGSGIMPEEAALELAKKGMNYKDILLYYYDKSSASNWKSVNFARFYDHNFVNYSGYKKCSRCGLRKPLTMK